MSGGFLGRWSQRKLSEKEKQEAQRSPDHLPGGEDDAPEMENRDNLPHDDAQEISAAPRQEETLSEEELAALPSLDSITTQTDLRQFLRKGVPGALKNAALRKMWLLDPAIRNHVDYAVDYAWDWNVPGGVPGHGGQIAGESVAKMLDKLLPKPVSDETATVPQPSDQAPVAPGSVSADESVDQAMQSLGDPVDEAEGEIASQPEGETADQKLPQVHSAGRPKAPDPADPVHADSDSMPRSEDEERISPRRHGGALPI